MKFATLFEMASACGSPYEWYNIESSTLTFAQCDSGFNNGTMCQINCSNGTPSIDSIRCHCLAPDRCKWLPRRRFTTIKCQTTNHHRSTAHVAIMARRGPIGARPRPKGLSRKSRLRLTAQDVVFTKRTAKETGICIYYYKLCYAFLAMI